MTLRTMFFMLLSVALADPDVLTDDHVGLLQTRVEVVEPVTDLMAAAEQEQVNDSMVVNDTADNTGYDVIGSGKCLAEGGDPKHQYIGGLSWSDCLARCDAKDDCYGYSHSNYNNCLLWLEPLISGGGGDWGSCHCNVKKTDKQQPEGCSSVPDALSPPSFHSAGQCKLQTNYDTPGATACNLKKYQVEIKGKTKDGVKFVRKVKTRAASALHEDFKPNQHNSKVRARVRYMVKEFADQWTAWSDWTEKHKLWCNEPETTITQATTTTSDEEEDNTEYEVLGSGKCLAAGGDPKHHYIGGKSWSECLAGCDARDDCYGYSHSNSNNCLLWLEPLISGGGGDWGSCHCNVKTTD